MRKFLHSNFELDLSGYKITDTAENPWFTGTYFAKYSYPFNIDLTDDIDEAMGFLSHYNSTDAETIFEGLYVHGNTLEKAVLEVEECQTGLSVTLRYGYDEFPNFQTKLAELPLIKENVTNIYNHAAVRIQERWPETPYNFPQIHIDKIDPDSDEVWAAFGKIINNYDGGQFLVNSVDLVNEVTYNRNIIQPLPYVLYLLKTGIEAAGYTLAGDILTDADLQKTLVYTDTEYYTTLAQESLTLFVPATEYDTYEETIDYPRITIARQITIPHPGKYRITGTIRVRRIAGRTVTSTVKYRDRVLFSHSSKMLVIRHDFKIDVVFETLSDLQANAIDFACDMGFGSGDIVYDIAINPIRLNDDTGEAIATILNLNEVDLTRAVPDMLFGDFVKLILSMKNMSITADGSIVYINYISNEIRIGTLIDLSMYEVKYPLRKYNKGNSFRLKYEDPNSEDYKYAEVFQNSEGYTTTGFTTDEKTTEISFKALPLPLLDRNGRQTAHGFLQDNSKPLFVMYDGLNSNNLNLSIDPANLLVPALHINYHEAWLARRINSYSFNWTFDSTFEYLLNLTVKSRVHAYTNLHLVKTIQKTEVSPDVFEIEIETEVIN